MKFRVVVVMLALSLLLTGCAFWQERSYSWVEDYDLPQMPESSQQISAANYQQLKKALTAIVARGSRQATISVAGYPSAALQQDLHDAVATVQQTDPIAAYAVDSILCETGTKSGEPVLLVQVSYRFDVADVRTICHVQDNAAAVAAIEKVLSDCQTGIVLHIQHYTEVDFSQLIEDYAMAHPETVMELPQIQESLYPQTGESRVVELKFSYQTSRDSLKQMQSQVAPVFSSAQLYVSGDSEMHKKYAQLYSFLMERFDYQLETSITPAYSLLHHGVGDSKAFAMVYAAMCRMSGLECMIVSGTKDGESHYWNIIGYAGEYRHVDLLCCVEAGRLMPRTDIEMTGYVWDYSACPRCVITEEMPEEK